MMHPPATPGNPTNGNLNGFHEVYIPETMREEVGAAVQFLVTMVHNEKIKSFIPRLTSTLTRILAEKYQDHWFPEAPDRGQGYRCIE